MTRQKGDMSFFGGRGELDSHSVVYGMRNWKVDGLGRLCGMVFSQSWWTPGENVALCFASPRPAGYMPMTGMPYTSNTTLPQGRVIDHTMNECPHGFYAYYDGSRDYHQRGDVTGVIRGWGEGVVGEKGFRVTRAQIVALKFSGSISQIVRRRVAGLYQVDVFDTVDRMLEKWPTTAGDLEYVPEADDEFWTREA